MMHFDLFKLTSKQSNKSIKKVTIYYLKLMVLNNHKLHFTTTRFSTFSGFNLALSGLTTLLETEKTRSDLDEAAGTGKTTLASKKEELRLMISLLQKKDCLDVGLNLGLACSDGQN